MRLVPLALSCVLVACGTREPRPEPARPIAPRDDGSSRGSSPVRSPFPFGMRLPDTIEPLNYRLRLEIDPERTTFRGRVEIEIAVRQPARDIVLHGRELAITSAYLEDGTNDHPLAVGSHAEHEMIALSALRDLRANETVVIDYTGTLRSDQLGLFRQRANGAWYVFSQGQSVFTRLFVPCFDEPRWKTPWSVSLVVPPGQVALANAPQRDERTLPDGRREVGFAPVGPIPSYLVALAIGPFALVEQGSVGASQIPFRVAVMPELAGQITNIRERTDKLLRWQETYFDAKLRWAKLDFVAVPEFFGAMENPGLVTFEVATLFDDGSRDESFAAVAAHELAHQWLGNEVTPAWWDDLWVAEGFAQYLGDATAAEVGEAADRAWTNATTRATAVIGDATSPVQLRHPIELNGAIDDAFDTTTYTKGAAVVAMLERALGSERLRAVLRALVTRFAARTATAGDLLALVEARDAATAAWLRWILEAPGVPTVDLELRCSPGTQAATVVARGRDGARLPVCARVEGQTSPEPVCGVIADAGAAELSFALAKGTACPAWVIGNAGGVGYYLVGADPKPAPLRVLVGPERIARGADMAASFLRGQRTAEDALGMARILLARPDDEARMGALYILRAVDTVVDAKTRPVWNRWLAAQLSRIVELASGGGRVRRPATVTASASTRMVGEAATELVFRRVDKKRFAALIAKARKAGDRDQAQLLEELGAVEAALVPDVVMLMIDGTFPASRVTPAVLRLLARSDTRDAVWAVLQPRLRTVFPALPITEQRELVIALGGLCSAQDAMDVEELLESIVRRDALPLVSAASTNIDRCARAKAAAGDIRAALRR